MSVAERVAHASNRLYDAVRSPKARQAAEREPARGDLSALEGHKYCLVTTYKRSGEPVSTPLWFGLDGGKLYFRTYADAVKLKRIRNNPRVLVGPCDPRGKPTGEMVEAAARILPGERHEEADRIVQSNYGFLRRLYKWSFSGRVEDAYVEVTAV
jgi:PPOX class probable F420-dependent enzyme